MAHTLALAAERYLETSPGCLPTGRALPVAGTPFDFRAAKAVGRDIDTAAEQLRLVNGYDHHFCVDGAGLRRAAVLRGDSSGIAMTMDTTSPGVQLYTANWLSRRGGKNGAVYEPRCAVCLEPQFPPDAVHHPGFPQPLLRRGKVYRHCYYCAEPMTTRTCTSVPGAAGGSTFPVMGVPSTAMEAIPFSTW